MKIFVDMDGVLVDFVGGVSRMLGIEYPAKYGEIGPWDIGKAFGVDPDDIWPRLQFLFWSNLDPLPWCIDLLMMCELAVGMGNVSILTTQCGSEFCSSGKENWVRERLPKRFLESIIITKDKHLVAARDRILIDDNEENIDAWNMAGGFGVLFPAPWNRYYPVENPMEGMKTRLLDILEGV